jgi:hypothetical protein
VTFNLGAETLSRSPHDEFLELCAVSTSGELTGEEQVRLQEHLDICASCREAMKQYEIVVSETMPALALDHPARIESDPSWSQDQAEADFFQRLSLEENLDMDRRGGGRNSSFKDVGKVALSASQATWRNVWTLYAAGILLCIALGVSAYRMGIHRGTESASVAPLPGRASETTLQQQLADAGHEREILRAQIDQRDKALTSLRHELNQQSTEMGRMKLAQNQLELDTQKSQAGRQAGSCSRAIRLEPEIGKC